MVTCFAPMGRTPERHCQGDQTGSAAGAWRRALSPGFRSPLIRRQGSYQGQATWSPGPLLPHRKVQDPGQRTTPGRPAPWGHLTHGSQHVHPPGTGHPPRPPSAPCRHGPGLSMQWGLCSTIRPVTQLRPETCHLRLRKRGPLGDKLGQGHVATTETRTKVSATCPMRTEPGAHPSGRHQAPSPTERPRSGSCCHLDGTRNRSPAKGYTGRQPLTHRGAWGGANQG